MKDGLKLLNTVVEAKLNRLSLIDFSSFIYHGVNLLELESDLKDDYSSIGMLEDDVIRDVLSDSEHENDFEALKLIRDLFVGKKEYAIDVDLNDKYKNKIKDFIDTLTQKLESKEKGITKIDEIKSKCDLLKHQIRNQETITDTEFIRELVDEYDLKNSVDIMLKIMIYVAQNNINIANTIYTPSEYIVDIDNIKFNYIDERIESILTRLGISIDSLDSKIVKELENCDVENFIAVYDLIHRNKVERYGILHLINKTNITSIILLMIYSNPDAIKNVVDELKDNSHYVEMIRSLLNNSISVFFVKESDIFPPHYFDFILCINKLKELKVNYRDLISRCPNFMNSDFKEISYVLNELKTLGFNEKDIINRCYKQLSIKPSLLIDNTNVLKTFGIDIKDYIAKDNYKYLLLKCHNLYLKLDYICNEYHISRKDIDYNEVAKLIVARIVKECDKPIRWGEEYD